MHDDEDEDDAAFVRAEDQFAIVIRNTIVLDSSVSATRVLVPGKSLAFGATRPDGTEYWVALGKNVLEDGLVRLAEAPLRPAEAKEPPQ